MTLSVVVPLMNAAGHVEPLMACLARQSAEAEYVFVDDGSVDGTFEALKATMRGGTRLKGCVLGGTGNRGSYSARNLGIESASGEIIVFTDADCRPHPEWLSGLLRAFDDACVGVAGGEILHGPGRSWIERYSRSRGMLSQRNTLRHPFLPYLQTANLAVRRKTFDEIGFFRAELRSGGDADLCWRATRAGWKMALTPAAVVEHQHRTTVRGLVEQQRRYGSGTRTLHSLYGFSLDSPHLRRRRIPELAIAAIGSIPWAAYAAYKKRQASMILYPALDMVSKAAFLGALWKPAAMPACRDEEQFRSRA